MMEWFQEHLPEMRAAPSTVLDIFPELHIAAVIVASVYVLLMFTGAHEWLVRWKDSAKTKKYMARCMKDDVWEKSDWQRDARERGELSREEFKTTHEVMMKKELLDSMPTDEQLQHEFDTIDKVRHTSPPATLGRMSHWVRDRNNNNAHDAGQR